MARKQSEPLAGFNGQEPTYKLADGRELPAGELVEQAAKRYHQANPGLDESQVTAAWNNLEDARRRDWCDHTIEALNDALGATTKLQDKANVANTVTTAERKLGEALIDVTLQELRALPRPWQQMTEDQQHEVLERVASRAREAVGETIRLLGTNDQPHLVCELEQITVKKGAKIVLTAESSALSELLFDSVGLPVILVIGGSLGEEKGIAAPAADPQQPDLLANAHLGSGVGGDGGPDGAQDPGTVQHSDPAD